MCIRIYVYVYTCRLKMRKRDIQDLNSRARRLSRRSLNFDAYGVGGWFHHGVMRGVLRSKSIDV